MAGSDPQLNLSVRLLTWYRAVGRELPWRADPSPYRVWVSEIMLQQTRIEAVKPYFERFMRELPDVETLSKAEEDRVLKLWEGLGYYSRARNLRRAAQTCVKDYGGDLPANYEKLLELPGIGPYTAGAIGSIAFSLPVPAVDGNVMRVMTRILADSGDITKASVKRRVESALRKEMPEEAPGTFNQALMELGERVCIPNGQPLCEACPVSALCRARKEGNPQDYPVRAPKRMRRVEQKTILLIRCGDRYGIRRRPEKGLLAGMYEFPALEGHRNRIGLMEWLAAQGQNSAEIRPLPASRHAFSHVEWEMMAYEVVLPDPWEKDWFFASTDELREKYSLPTAFRTYTNIVFGG